MPFSFAVFHTKPGLRFTVFLFVSMLLLHCSDNDDLYLDMVWPAAQSELYRQDSAFLDFFVLSDWGYNGHDDQRKVAGQMEQVASLVNPHFILTCGDNFQEEAINSPLDSLWSANYEQVYRDSSLFLPWYPALGNHDYSGDPEAQVAYSALSKRWQMPARYYSFVQSVDTNTIARFIILDTEGLIRDYKKLKDASKYKSISQYVWLKEVLSETTADWVFIVGHHPVYSASSYHGDTKEMKVMINPLLDAYNVDFYLCGHDHNFEHAQEECTDYIVTGTGGYVRSADSNKRTVFSVSRLGFTHISLSRNLAQLHFITAEGKIAYRYEKRKN